MKKYEYKLVKTPISCDFERHLQELGTRGFRAVNFYVIEYKTRAPDMLALMEREIPEDPQTSLREEK